MINSTSVYNTLCIHCTEKCWPLLLTQGMYSQLVLAILKTLSFNSSSNSSCSSPLRAPSSRKVRHTAQHHHRCLLASEVVHLMCLVPTFFDALIEADQGQRRPTNVHLKNAVCSFKHTFFDCLPLVATS